MTRHICLSGNQNRVLILIFFIALIIRLIFVMFSADAPSSDAASYDNLGLSMSLGKGYVNIDGTPHSFRPPFYPFFLAIVYKIFGHSYLAVRVIQSLFGAFTCVLIFLIGRRLCNIKIGAWSAFISAVYPVFIKSAELLLTESIFTFLLALIVLYLLKIQEDLRNKDCVLLGLLAGAALLTKSMMALFPFFIIPVFFNARRQKFLNIFKKYMIVLLSFGIAVLPWVIRNYNVFHKFVLVSTQGGVTFYSSYCPPNGIFGMLPSRDDPVIAEASKIASPVLRSDFLFKKTLEFILNNPKKVLVLGFKKLLYLWAPFDWEIIGARWFNFIYAAMLPFFAMGLFLAFRKFNKFYPILAPIIYIQITSLIFYGSPRFRLPIEPYLFILSIMVIMKLHDNLFGKRKDGYENICNNAGF